MYYLPAQNAAASKITVTATATSLYDLINTAGSTALPRAGYPVDTNGLEIRLESGGNARVFFEGNTPTSTNGWLLQEGETWRFCGTNLDKLKLIRVTGNVVCSVQLGKADRSESGVYMIASAGGGGGDVNIIEIGGTAVSVDSGDADAGTIRTVNADRAGTATLSNVASSASNVTVLASNASRKGAILYNDSTSAVNVKFGATASSSSFSYRLLAGATLELPVFNGVVYQGIIDGIWDSANGSMRVTELT